MPAEFFTEVVGAADAFLVGMKLGWHPDFFSGLSDPEVVSRLGKGMSRPLRFLPPNGALVEVTLRTLQGRFLLRPSRPINDIVVGVFAKAQRRYGVGVCGLAVLSNHYHALLRVDSSQQLARFMNFVNGNLARKIGRRVGWRQKFWGQRYTAIPVSQEEAVQIARLRYLLSQGVKEDLVERPERWPGVHCAQALSRGEPLRGSWVNQTELSAAIRRGDAAKPGDHTTAEELVLTPLPCWEGLPAEEVRRRVTELIEEIVTEHRRRRARSGLRVLGRRRVLRGRRPRRLKGPERRPTPRFHAATHEVRRRWREAYRSFVSAYRRAAERLRAGDRSVEFPPGAFPPALPFVPPVGSRVSAEAVL